MPSSDPLPKLRDVCLALPEAHEVTAWGEPTFRVKNKVPPYVGPSGWVGVWLDKPPRWNDVKALLQDGYRQIAPKTLLARYGHGV